jgi:hypothetical protein
LETLFPLDEEATAGVEEAEEATGGVEEAVEARGVDIFVLKS